MSKLYFGVPIEVRKQLSHSTDCLHCILLDVDTLLKGNCPDAARRVLQIALAHQITNDDVLDSLKKEGNS